MLLMCYTAKQDSSSTRGAEPLHKDFLALVFCDNFRDFELRELNSV